MSTRKNIGLLAVRDNEQLALKNADGVVLALVDGHETSLKIRSPDGRNLLTIAVVEGRPQITHHLYDGTDDKVSVPKQSPLDAFEKAAEATGWKKS